MSDELFLTDEQGGVIGKLPPDAELARLITVEPSYKNFVNYCISLRVNGCPRIAITTLLKCIDQYPGRPEAYHNIGLCYADIGQFDEAENATKLAWKFGRELDPAYKRSIASGYAYALMRNGKFADAWPLWEYGRLNVSWRPAMGTEVWDGSPGKKVIVIPEGGYGDAFLFRRWLPLLKQRCAYVKLAIWESLANWCNWTALGVDEIEPIKPGAQPFFNAVTHDPEQVSISWMSLPGILGMNTWEDVPHDQAFLGTYPSLSRTELRIGFCWHAEENGSLRRIRSLDDHVAQEIAKELHGYGRRIHSLVPFGKHLHLAAQPKIPLYVDQSEAAMETWRQTSAFVASMDFVVTVDTAVAHLCGLFGVKTLLLVPLSADWKWTQGQHLYGPHLKVFRNTKTDWDVDEIKQTIREELCQYGQNSPSR